MFWAGWRFTVAAHCWVRQQKCYGVKCVVTFTGFELAEMTNIFLRDPSGHWPRYTLQPTFKFADTLTYMPTSTLTLRAPTTHACKHTHRAITRAQTHTAGSCLKGHGDIVNDLTQSVDKAHCEHVDDARLLVSAPPCECSGPSHRPSGVHRPSL